MKTIHVILLILCYFSQMDLSLATNSIHNIEGEPKEKIINFLSDPKINSANEKIVVLKTFLDNLNADEIISIILPKINNLQEFMELVKDYDDLEKIAVLYSHSPFGPLAKFLNTVKDILTSNHAGEISTFLDDYKIETLKLSPSTPKARLKQVIAELEVWNYMFYELGEQIDMRASASFKAKHKRFISNSSKGIKKGKGKKPTYPSKRKKRDQWQAYTLAKQTSEQLIIEHLGIVHLVTISEQFLDQDVVINLVEEGFWLQFWSELQENIDLFPFRSSLKKGNLDAAIRDAINCVFIASMLATQIAPNLTDFTSESIDLIDEWDEEKITEFLANVEIPHSGKPLVQSKLAAIGRLVESNN